MIHFLRLRPFLWPLVLLVPAWAGTFWLERGISYDDGGLGAFSFFTSGILGFAGSLLGESLLDGTIDPRGGLANAYWGLCGVVAVIPYIALDAWTQRFLRQRTEQGR